MDEIYPAKQDADLIVFASPLYFWTFSARLKAFIERLYCIAQKDEDPACGRYERNPVKDAVLLLAECC